MPRACPDYQSVHEVFETQVCRTPDARAVIFEFKALMYQELNVKDNRLTGRLQQEGVCPRDFVPVLMKRSLELVISYLAILIAGVAIVPLDQEWPSERIKALLTQLQGQLEAATQDTPSFNDLSDWNGVVVDGAGHQELPENLSLSVQLDDPVYVMFTSESTRNPKGAIKHHRGMVNRLWNIQERYPWSIRDVMLETLRHTFDASLRQYFWLLLPEARLVLSSPFRMVNQQLSPVQQTLALTYGGTHPYLLNMLQAELVGAGPDVQPERAVERVKNSLIPFFENCLAQLRDPLEHQVLVYLIQIGKPVNPKDVERAMGCANIKPIANTLCHGGLIGRWIRDEAATLSANRQFSNEWYCESRNS